MALFIVATPIGNLEDITFRAIRVLNEVDLILAEDTRVTRILLDKYNVKKELQSYHQHSGLEKLDKIIDMLKRGKMLALVTDAGTPGISDPGNYLIQEVLKELPDLKIIPIPGPNAAVTALSVSGFYSDNFVFLGFPPHKKGRQTFFKKIGDIDETVVFYESKHRILKALGELKEFSELGERPVVVARELTKQFETIYRGTASEISDQLSRTKVLGEFVIVIEKRR